MKIRKLEIAGFKSFKDRTIIHFDEGITGVVGPNGCGKSNIVDAFQWVMGEMSAKSLRGSSMSHMIFQGAQGYEPAHVAEVSLFLEGVFGSHTVTGAGDVAGKEIQITRRLHRSGESEYFMNRQPVRLRDIQELFMDTGVGARGVSIIEQGTIGRMIVAKPEERRRLIDEAAGITKFKARERESQRKLAATEQNILRLNDIVAELKRQLDGLQRQAKKALRYKDLKSQAQELDLRLSSQEFHNIQATVAESTSQLGEKSEQRAAGLAKIAELENRVQSVRLEQVEKEKKIQAREQEQESLHERVTSSEQSTQKLSFEITQCHRENERRIELQEEAKKKQVGLQAELSAQEEVDSRTKKEVLELKTRVENIAQRETEINTQLQSKEQKERTCQESLKRYEQEEREKSDALNHVRIKHETLQIQINEIEPTLSLLSSEESQLLGEQKQKEIAKQESEQWQSQSTSNVMEQESLFAQLKDREIQGVALLSECKENLGEVSGRLYALQSAQENLEGFQEGVRSTLQRHREAGMEQNQNESKKKQVLISLAEVIQVSKEYEVALESVLERRLQMLLGANAEDVLDAVEHLKTARHGRASFLCLSEEAVVEEHRQEKSAPFGGELLKKQVMVPQEYVDWISPFLARVVVLDDVRFLLEKPQEVSEWKGWAFVSRAGDVLEPVQGGVILTGGAGESASLGLLKRQREIRELTEKKQNLEQQYQAQQMQVQDIRKKVVAAEDELKSLQDEKMQSDLQCMEVTKDLEQVKQRVVQVTEQKENLLKEREALLAAREESEQTEERLAQEHEDVLSTIVQLRKRIQEEEQGVGLQRKSLEEVRGEVMQLKSDLAAKTQASAGESRHLEHLAQQLQEITQQLTGWEQEEQHNQENLLQLQEQKEAADANLESELDQLSQLQSLLSRLKEEHGQFVHSIQKKQEEILSLRQEQTQIQSEENEVQLGCEQLKMRQEALKEHIQERYGCHLEDYVKSLFGGENTTFITESSERAEKEKEQLKDLREKLQRMGEINLAAADEFGRVSERYEFLISQRQDLFDSKQQLCEVMARIQRICRGRFKETYMAINAHFQRVFPVLFGGGEAQLALIESEEGDGDRGIDLIVRPPGKKLQSVTLLSGGEKALTAISLVFAIFLVSPSPYCLLDEVDAPLDDANVFRFNELVKEMATKSQVILVTHNKNTMEVADTLYGVTMEEKGVSKMVSVQLSQAAEVVKEKGVKLGERDESLASHMIAPPSFGPEVEGSA